MWSVKDKAMAVSMDQDVLVPQSAEQTNRSVLPLSFQPTMPRPPRIRSGSVRSYSSAEGEDSVKRNSEAIELNRMSSFSSTAEEEAQAEVDEVTLSSSLVFHTEYYLTYLRNKEDYDKANIKPDQQKYLKFGRPNVPQLMADTRKLCEAEGIKRVAVFVCGPAPLVNEVVDYSRASKFNPNPSTVRFDCHSELFDF